MEQKKTVENYTMARIQARKGKTRTTFTATVRVKNFDPIARTFDTDLATKKWSRS